MNTLEVNKLKYSRKQSIINAFAGFKVIWVSEINFRIHIIISLLVLCAGFIFKLNTIEWVGILLCIGLVLGAEIFNTAIEHLCDLTSKEIKPEIKAIKDISAFGVLFLAMISSIVGIIIFLPKIIYIFKSI
jgi:diacylglycerol kinase